MNRFQKAKTSRRPSPALLFSTILLIGSCLFFFFGIQSISETTLQKQQEGLAHAILKSAVHCYAVEGTYPESLDYLKKHYGISYDETRFLVSYEVIGSNLMPDVRVFLLKGGSS